MSASSKDDSHEEDAPVGLKALILVLMDKNLSREEIEAYLSQRKYTELSDEERKTRYLQGVEVHSYVTVEAAYWNLENISHRSFYNEERTVKA
jgi:hypothetical protein